MKELCSYCNCYVSMPCQNLEDMAECGNPEIIINNKLLQEKAENQCNDKTEKTSEGYVFENYKPPYGAYTMADWDDENY